MEKLREVLEEDASLPLRQAAPVEPKSEPDDAGARTQPFVPPSRQTASAQPASEPDDPTASTQPVVSPPAEATSAEATPEPEDVAARTQPFASPPRQAVSPSESPSEEAVTDSVPEVADGVELLGEYEGSGFKEKRYMARRSNGDLIQLTELLYMIVEEIDGSSDHAQIAARVSDRYGRTVTADNVKVLIARNLVPDGFVVGPDGAEPEVKKLDPLLALKFKFTLLPQSVVMFVAGLLRPLFWPPLIVAALIGLIALDIWYFGTHGMAQSLRDLIYQPLIVLLVYGLLIVSILWHELGHATACRYGGARPGRVGFGIYIVWPAFFTDVTDALTLGKGGRVRTDLGGLYFNVLFSLAIGGVYFLTGFEPLLVLILMQHLLMLYNLMPFLRLDGYHAISDITGIPDLFGRIKPTVKGLIPGRGTPKAVQELKPWARTVVTVWVVLVIPILLYFFGMMVLSAPRVLATGWDSLSLQWEKVEAGLADGGWAQVAVGGLQSVMIVLPTTGMLVSFSRIGKRIARGFWNFTEERPWTRGGLGVVGLAAVGAAVFMLIPNGEYKPIQPDERWTFSEGVEAASTFSTGRPSLTEQREEQLGGAPSLQAGADEEFVPSYRRDDAGTTTGDTEETVDDPDSAETPIPEDDPSAEDAVTEEELEPTPTPEATPSD